MRMCEEVKKWRKEEVRGEEEEDEEEEEEVCSSLIGQPGEARIPGKIK